MMKSVKNAKWQNQYPGYFLCLILGIFLIAVSGIRVSAEEESGEDLIQILLIGQDRREGQDRQRSDAMILVTLNEEEKTLTLTSFMRDLYVDIPGYGKNRINAAYQLGGMELLDQVLEESFDVQVDGNIEVDFAEFQSFIDMIGGVDVTLTQDEADYICGRKQDVLYPQIYREDWNLTEGVNTLNGEQALIHARNRSIGNNDYRRTERQREVIQGAFEKIKDADLKTVLSYVEKGFSMITTDMSKGEIAGYLMKGMLLGITEAESIRIPQDGASTSKTINGMQVLVPDLELCREYLKENI